MNEDKTIQLVSLALDAGFMRQTAIANNIANANTQGYQPLQVNFEAQLAALTPAQHDTSLLDVKPFYEPAASNSIDDQLALSVKNATQVRALIKGLNHKLAIMKLALAGNNAA